MGIFLTILKKTKDEVEIHYICLESVLLFSCVSVCRKSRQPHSSLFSTAIEFEIDGSESWNSRDDITV